MAIMTRFEYSHTENTGGLCDNTHWYGQTFTPIVTHTLREVVIKAYRDGSPGTCQVDLYETSGGEPTGAVKATGTFDADVLTTDSAGEEVHVPMSSYELLEGVKYAAVVKGTAAGDLYVRIEVVV
jgi:hypothetical protein